jgi:capsular polysaccharide biosynthesis protein
MLSVLRRLPAPVKSWLYRQSRRVVKVMAVRHVLVTRGVEQQIPSLAGYWDIPYDRLTVRSAQDRIHDPISEPEKNLYVCALNDVNVLVSKGIVKFDNAKLWDESGFKSWKIYQYARNAGSDEPTLRLSGRLYAIIMVPTWYNYYHWHIDILTRLYELAALDISEPVTLLISGDLKPFQVSTLNWCLPPNVTVEYVAGDERWIHVEKLLFPAIIRPRTNFMVPREALDYVRNAILSGVHALPTRRPGLRIYISRAKAVRRRVLNEAEVVACLTKHGFQIVQLETLPVEEQVCLLHQAEYIVAPHGAGLTNILFAEHATILEFVYDAEWISNFRRMASILGHQHHSLGVEQKSKDTDMWIDIEQLERKLVEIGL